MRKATKQDKIDWLLSNQTYLKHIPIIFKAKRTPLEKEQFKNVVDEMRKEGLYSYIVSTSDITVSIIKLANEARNTLRRIHAVSSDKRETGVRKNKFGGQPSNLSLEMRADAIRQGPL